ALGLLLRAFGAGLRIYMVQFIKGRESSELKAIRKHLPTVTVEQYGLGRFAKGLASPDDVETARKGLSALRQAIVSEQYDLVIADEINVAIQVGLFDVRDVLSIIDAKPDSVEVVLTGRDAHPMLQERADLVTEMLNVKHYYGKGVPARIGIEE
ncbi:MAG: cob(I)yrinic acid a,c-diamide adenosyltransferase, partial [Thermodesulfobacteriota bacterium]|nr:cob(I)yrinic acid a,c-diamide adenosyltransferase [Thermodesulfobacteriota bacterium]